MNRGGADEPRVPRFSIRYMDLTADPATKFYDYATGTWRRENPTPADKAVWGAGAELVDRNYRLIRQILESAAEDATAPTASPRRQVGDLYASALDIDRRNALGLRPVQPLLDRVGRATHPADLVPLLAELHDAGVYALFQPFAYPDRNRSSVYAFYLYQGGLSLPDREYDVADSFSAQREAFRSHVGRIFRLAVRRRGRRGGRRRDGPGDRDRPRESQSERDGSPGTIRRTTIRSPWTSSRPGFPGIAWADYLPARRADVAGDIVLGQPEFFEEVGRLLASRPVADWGDGTFRWHVLHENAPYLSAGFETENFDFFHHSLQGQTQPEPDWKRAALTIDQQLGEALGRLYVERHFPPEARARMADLVADLCAVFRVGWPGSTG